MPVKVVMPQLGESVVEGTVSRWLKQEGDEVQEYDPLVEVSTDKVDTEIPAPSSGKLLKIYIPEGETVEHGTLLAVIGQPGEQPADSPEAPVVQDDLQDALNESLPDEIEETAGAEPNGNGGSGHVTPVVARMLAEHNLDVNQIKGTGRGGRVTKKDVEAYLERGSQAAGEAQADDVPPWERPGTGDLFKPTVDYGEGETEPRPLTAARVARPASPAKRAPSPAAAAQPLRRVHPAEPVPEGSPGRLVPLTPIRRLIAEHMVRSKLKTSPHVTTVFEVDMSRPLAHREAHKAEFAAQGVNLTLTAYFVSATVSALRQTPHLNAEWTDEGIYLHHALHIGIAVALDEGLIVPVIHNAQDLNVMGLARAVNDLAARARQKQLKPEETQGGTFTITNHGVRGSLFATPIINQPQVGILGVGVVEKRVKVIEDAIAIRPCAYLSLTFDHRVVDGATADSFMLVVKDTLEKWPP